MDPETQVSSRRIYTGRVVNLRVDRVRLPDGRQTEREVVEHRGAAVIVALTEARDVLLVRQFRYAAGEALLEIPAGTLEEGEDPLTCARRELREEVGAHAAHWELLTVLLPSPGVMTERMHLFLATEVTEGQAEGTADEFLTVERVPLAAAVDLVRRGEIRDAKSIAGILLVALRLKA